MPKSGWVVLVHNHPTPLYLLYWVRCFIPQEGRGDEENAPAVSRSWGVSLSISPTARLLSPGVSKSLRVIVNVSLTDNGNPTRQTTGANWTPNTGDSTHVQREVDAGVSSEETTDNDDDELDVDEHIYQETQVKKNWTHGH